MFHLFYVVFVVGVNLDQLKFTTEELLSTVPSLIQA
jgi:hypothetical protein